MPGRCPYAFNLSNGRSRMEWDDDDGWKGGDAPAWYNFDCYPYLSRSVMTRDVGEDSAAPTLKTWT